MSRLHPHRRFWFLPAARCSALAIPCLVALTACSAQPQPPSIPFVQQYQATTGDLFYFGPDGRFVLLGRRGALDAVASPNGWQAFAYPAEITVSRPAEPELGDPPGARILENRRFAQTSVPFEHLACSPAGAVLAGGSSSRTVTVWDLDSTQAQQWPQPSTVASLAFSPDGALLAVGVDAHAAADGGTPTEPGTVRLLEYPGGAVVARFGTLPCTAVAFSPDGTLVAAFSDASFIVRKPSGDLMPPVAVGGAKVPSIALHPSGAVVALARSDKTIDLWDIAAGRRIATLTSDSPPDAKSRGIERVAFNAAGTQLAAACSDGQMLLWDTSALNAKAGGL